MKKFIAAGLLISNFVFAQNTKIDTLEERHNDESLLTSYEKPEPLTKKGQMFVFWGWNRAGFSNSDIRFKGNGYDFTLNNVVHMTDLQN